jgi:hypothetical protein
MPAARFPADLARPQTGESVFPHQEKPLLFFATREVFLSRLFLELTANLDYNKQKITFDGFSGTNRVQETRKHA